MRTSSSVGDLSIFNLTQHLGVEGAEVLNELYLNDVDNTIPIFAIPLMAVSLMIFLWCCKGFRPSSLLQTEAAESDLSAGVLEGMLSQFLSEKLGLKEGQSLKKCLTSWKAESPTLLKKAGFNPNQFREAFKDVKKDPKQQMQLLWRALRIFLATHGTVIASKGLEGIGLEACGQVVCAGDLSYQSGSMGHFCEWNCPADLTPSAFDFIPAEAIGSWPEASEEDKELLQKDEELLESTSGWKVLKKIPFEQGMADSEVPLTLLKRKDGDGSDFNPRAMLYRGSCAER